MNDLGLPDSITELALEYDSLDDTVKKEVAAREQAIKDEETFNVNVQQAMRNKPTRILVWRLLELAGLYDIPDGRLDYFNGRRAVGCDLLKILAIADQNIYIELLNENKGE